MNGTARIVLLNGVGSVGKSSIARALQAIAREPFLHVRMDELVRTKIPVDYVGTPAGVKLGGIMQVQGTHIDVEGLPDRLPSVVTADIRTLAVGETYLVGQLSIPPGVNVLSPAEELLVSIVAPKVEQPVAEAQ